jgi:OOP family OmpA-OmpF porin
VGGNDYNLRLSQRRAEAVKQALISEYAISADRMTPEGFGASQPKATNETIEGRALNRRVELVRE